MSKFFNSQDLNDINIVYDDFGAGQFPIYMNEQNSLSLESTPPKRAGKKRAKSTRSRDAPEVEIAPKRRAKSASGVAEGGKKAGKVAGSKKAAPETAEVAAAPVKADEAADLAHKAPEKVRKMVKKVVKTTKPPKLPPPEQHDPQAKRPKRSSTPSEQVQQEISDIEKMEKRGRSPSVLGDKYTHLLLAEQAAQASVAQQHEGHQIETALQAIEQENEKRQREMVDSAAAIVNSAVDELRMEFEEMMSMAKEQAATQEPTPHQPAESERPLKTSFLQTDTSIHEFENYPAAKPSDQSIIGQSQMNEIRYTTKEAQLRMQQTELKIDEFMQKMETKIDSLVKSQQKPVVTEEPVNGSSEERAEPLQETLQDLMRQMELEQENYMEQCELIQQEQINEIEQQLNAERERQQNIINQESEEVEMCLKEAEAARQIQLSLAEQNESRYNTLLSAAAQENCGDRGDISQELKWLFATL